MHLPLVALNRVTLLELRISDDHTDAVRALNWALPRTDTAIWCTEFFTGDEQGLWNAVPEVIKDHALLVRTKADKLREDWDIAEDRLRAVALRNFAHIHAISAEQALASRLPDGSTDRVAMKQSGGMAIISTIRRQLEASRRAAADQADILLAQHDVPKDEVAEVPRAEPQQLSLEDKVRRAKEAIRQRTGPRPVPVLEIADQADEPPVEGEVRRALSDAASHLRDAGTALSRTTDPKPQRVMTRSLEAIEELSERLMPLGPKAHPAIARTIDAAARAADLLEQLKIDPQDEDRVKAITVLLQVKRGVEADLAA